MSISTPFRCKQSSSIDGIDTLSSLKGSMFRYTQFWWWLTGNNNIRIMKRALLSSFSWCRDLVLDCVTDLGPCVLVCICIDDTITAMTIIQYHKGHIVLIIARTIELCNVYRLLSHRRCATLEIGLHSLGYCSHPRWLPFQASSHWTKGFVGLDWFLPCFGSFRSHHSLSHPDSLTT